MDSTTVESLHGSLCRTWVVVLYKSVVEAFRLELGSVVSKYPQTNENLAFETATPRHIPMGNDEVILQFPTG